MSLRLPVRAALALCAGLASACASSSDDASGAGATGGGQAGADAGATGGGRDGADAGALPAPDAGPADGGPATCDLPAAPYGVAAGDRFEGFTFSDCDARPYALYEGDFCAAQLTLVTVGAGWCPPCNEEAAVLEADFYQRFRARGLRIVQVLFEDDRSDRATKTFCKEWRAKYGLTFPVVIDPLFKTMAWMGEDVPPLNLLVDGDGVIRYRHAGALESDLADRIDALLPAP